MKKIFIVLSCLVFLAVAVSAAEALQNEIKDIIVEKKADTIEIIFKTKGKPQLIAYDIPQPPQIIIDIIGDSFTDIEENISVHSGAIEQIKVVKTSAGGKDYYGVDFWIIELTETVGYEFSRDDDTYLLTLAKSGAVKLKKKKVSKKQLPLKPQTTLLLPQKEDIAIVGITEEELPSVSVSPVSPAAYQPSKQAIQLRQKGYRYQVDKKYKEAIKYYKKAIAYDPYYATVYNDLGVIYYRYLNKTKKAIEEFQKALEIDPNYLCAHTNLALIYEELGRKETALRHWAERARFGNPEDYWTKLAIQKLEESTNE